MKLPTLLTYYILGFSLIASPLYVRAAPLCTGLFDTRATSSEVLKSIVDAFDRGDSESIVNSPKVVIRVLRGTETCHFKCLTHEAQRLVVFMTDNRGLATLAGLKGDTLLRSLGYTQEYINSLRKSGTQFKMAILRNTGGFVSGTWRNLRLVLEKVYPNTVIPHLFARYQSELRSLSFEDIQDQAPAPLSQLKALAMNHKYRITASKLRHNSSLWEFRAFLYNDLSITELYTGNGFTLLENGQRGIPEYIGTGAHTPIRDLSDSVVIDIE